MTILNQLSSQVGDRTEHSNRLVASRCVEEPDLIRVIADGLKSEDAKMQADCAEVLAQVAENCPDLVAPHARILARLLGHEKAKVRWEAAHALQLIVPCAPTLIARSLPMLASLISDDESVIVRDHATDAIANYASLNRRAAQRAYPYLRQALTTWQGKQAGHALAGLARVAHYLPDRKAELRATAKEFSNSSRAVVRHAAKRLLKAAES